MKLNHDNSSNTLSGALKITEEREMKLQESIRNVFENHSETISEDLEKVAEFCETPEELAWAAFEFGTNVGREEGNPFASIFGSMAGVSAEGGDDDGIGEEFD